MAPYSGHHTGRQDESQAPADQMSRSVPLVHTHTDADHRLHKHARVVPHWRRASGSPHGCPCERRQGHTASGESNLTTLQTLLRGNVTPTLLMTYYHPHPPLSPSIPAPPFPLFPPRCLLFACSVSFLPFLHFPVPLCCDFCYMCIKHTPWGGLGGKMCREMNAKTAAYRRYIVRYNILRIRAAWADLQE